MYLFICEAWKHTPVKYISEYFWWNGQGNQDSVVSVGTCYGLHVLGFDPLLGWDFLDPSTLALRPTQPPDNRNWPSFLRVKRPGSGVDLCSAKLIMDTAVPLSPLSASLACHDIALSLAREVSICGTLFFIKFVTTRTKHFQSLFYFHLGQEWRPHLLGLLEEANLSHWNCLCHWMKYLTLTHSDRPTD